MIGLELIKNNIEQDIQKQLNRIGILYRLHSRIKTADSITEKNERNHYSTSTKLMQDIIGFRVITYFIQQPYKRKLENKNKIMRNRHLALVCSIISITIMFFILWSIEMSSDPEGSLFLILFLTIEFVSVQIPFLLPIF